MIQYIKLVQNPSFGSRDRVQTRCFWSKYDIQTAGMTLKMRSMSPSSNHFFSMSQWCFFVGLVRIHQLVQEIECRKRLIYTVLIMWWPWKLGQGYQNLINSFNYPIDTIHEVWPESIIWFKRYGAGKPFWWKFHIHSAGVTFKIRSRSPRSNYFFPMSQW